eukprot:EG_transcript_22561
MQVTPHTIATQTEEPVPRQAATSVQVPPAVAFLALGFFAGVLGVALRGRLARWREDAAVYSMAAGAMADSDKEVHDGWEAAEYRRLQREAELRRTRREEAEAERRRRQQLEAEERMQRLVWMEAQRQEQHRSERLRQEEEEERRQRLAADARYGDPAAVSTPTPSSWNRSATKKAEDAQRRQEAERQEEAARRLRLAREEEARRQALNRRPLPDAGSASPPEPLTTRAASSPAGAATPAVPDVGAEQLHWELLERR